MGEVYTARDTRLDRTVAIKVLKPVLSEDPDFRQRFEREARTISQLNHPNICTLHDVGEAGSVSYLVMEYVEGETLAARIERGEIPLDQALACGVQIADALDKAHRRGIIHGDLKPGNVMLTKAGAKLLDFGLARQLPAAPPDVTDSATRALPMSGTPVLGTLPYLTPEQLEDRRADERSDIFAFGAVLYEVLTGRKAFSGATYAAVVAAIMRADPPAMASLRPSIPPALDRLVATCLSKDPDERWQNAGDLARELRWIASGGGGAGRAAESGTRRGVTGRAWAAIAALLVVALGSLVAVAYYLRMGDAAEVYRTSILLPEGLLFPPAGPLGGVGRFAISPDGRRIVFVASDPGGSVRLWIRPLDSLAATPLPGTDGAGSPFWSPDSRFVAFVAQGQLKTIDVLGGAPFTVTPAFNATGSWNRDNLILFTPSPASPLFAIPSTGGSPRQVTELDRAKGDVMHRSAFFLPDGRHFVYVAVSAREGETTGARAVNVGSLDATEPARLVFEGGSSAVYSSGHLVYLRDSRLVAQSFDLDRLELTGEPTPITDQVELTSPTSTGVSVSNTGLLVYQPASGPGSQLVWFDREGRRLGTLGDAADYGDIDLSPDGRRAAVTVLDGTLNTRDIWVFDVARGIRTRLTLDPADDVTPVWSADGTRIVFASNRAGHFDIYEKTATGVGNGTLVYKDESEKYPTAWTSDGRSLLYWTFGNEGALVRLLRLDETPSSRPLLGPPANPARLSPDGRWVAYYSNESGRLEVYVASFPDGAEKLQLSNAGGSLPQWRGDGQEVFYAGRDNRLMAVSVKPGNGDLEVTAPTALFEARSVGPRAFFDVLPDGQRFLVNSRRSDSPSSSITVLQNWTRLPPP
jgi:Tol biopolymer transport system component